jgi:geranylgeranyl diphosphate synthase, type I
VIRERALASTPGQAPSTVATPSAFARMRPLIDLGLRQAVERLSEMVARVAAYHMGWEDAEGHGIHGDGGKAVRPTISLLAAEAVGAEPATAISGAVAVELVHNFSLLHDDVMDGDLERRHRPTVWAQFGTGQAIIVGDALLALAEELLLEDPSPSGRAAAAELTKATAGMIEGQAQDLAFESRLDVTVAECLAMTSGKTGALLSCAAALGGILGGADPYTVDGLRAYGRHLGLAFQAVDDVLGIWGDPEVTGKPAANDLRQHKKSLPVAHALSRGGAVASELSGFLANGNADEDRVARAVQLLEESTSREWALGLADQHFDAALEALGGRRLDPHTVGELADVATFVVRRNF